MLCQIRRGNHAKHGSSFVEWMKQKRIEMMVDFEKKIDAKYEIAGENTLELKKYNEMLHYKKKK